MWKKESQRYEMIKKVCRKLVSVDFFYFLSSPKKWNMLYCYGNITKSENRMRENMSEDIKQRIANRRKCAYAMKRFNIKIFAVAIVILCLWCGILLAKVCILEQSLQNTSLQLEEIKGMLMEQQSVFESTSDENNAQDGNESIPEDTQLGVDEDNLYEESELPGEEETGHKVHLTFDDGPSIYTREILDILDQYDVKATFFVVGKENDVAVELLNEIVNRGHSLGMHSYSHDYSRIYQSVDTFSEDFKKLQDFLYDVTAVKSTLYRFPGGSSNTVSDVNMKEFADYLEEQGVTFYDWNISSGDGGSVQLPVENLVENCTKDIPKWKSSIILLHDSGDKRTTVDALPAIIENILAMEDTVILPITEETRPVQHINQ